MMNFSQEQLAYIYEVDLTKDDTERINEAVKGKCDDLEDLSDMTMYFVSLDEYVEYNYEDREIDFIESLVQTAYREPESTFTAKELLLENSDMALSHGGYLRILE